MGEPDVRAMALEAGYTAQHHTEGLLYYSFAARERTYGDWLDYEEQNPRADPDNKVLLEQIEALLDELSVEAAVGIARHVAPSERDELLSIVCDIRLMPTRFARAKARLSALRNLATRPFDGAARADEHMRRKDGSTKLALASGVLDVLRMDVREAPLEPERRAHILGDVMKFERHLASWLGAPSTSGSRWSPQRRSSRCSGSARSAPHHAAPAAASSFPARRAGLSAAELGRVRGRRTYSGVAILVGRTSR